MKKLILRSILTLNMLCFFPDFIVAQKYPTHQYLFDTIPFIPEHGKKRMAIFNAEPIIPGRIIFLGNSITENGDWKRLLGDTTVINRGIGGDITFGILRRLDEVLNRKPSKIFLMIGINDIGKDIPPTVIADNIRKIIRRIQLESPATRIILQNILPVSPMIKGFPQHYDKQSKVVETNKLLVGVAKETNVPLVDLNKIFRDGNGELLKKYTNDGLHLDPAGEGYAVWVKHLKVKGLL